MAILFKTGEWLSSDTDSGIIPPGSSETASITFDATDLVDGVYTGNIDLDSNDPTNPIVDIAVTFTVGETGTAQILQTPSSITETLESGESSTALLNAVRASSVAPASSCRNPSRI